MYSFITGIVKLATHQDGRQKKKSGRRNMRATNRFEFTTIFVVSIKVRLNTTTGDVCTRIYLTDSFATVRMRHKVSLKRNISDSNSEFSFLIDLPRLKSTAIPTTNAELRVGRKEWFMTFLRALVPSETQTALSRIWTRVADFIYYEHNRYVKCASWDIRGPKHIQNLFWYKIPIWWPTVLVTDSKTRLITIALCWRLFYRIIR